MKGTIVGVVATIIACVVGIGYTEWRNTDPNISGEWVNVSADMITLGLMMIGSAALFVLLVLAGRLLWPAVRRRLKSRRQRFMELAPELRELQDMTLVVTIPPYHQIPSLEERTRAFLMVKSLANLGIDCSPPIHGGWGLRPWRILEDCFEMLAVLAYAGELDDAKESAKVFREQIREELRK